MTSFTVGISTMPTAKLAFGQFAPDMAPHGHENLVTCTNVYPVSNGYTPVKAFDLQAEALTGWSGGGTFIEDSGTAIILAGTSAGLYKLTGGSWGLAYTSAASDRWRFSQHGNIVIGTHGGAPVAYNLTTSTGSALGGSPPYATYSVTVGNFTFLAGDPADVRTVSWSGFGNPENWTVGTFQCGKQTLPDGGEITGLAGGEFGLLFQRGGIYRYDYVGGEIVWQRTKISTEVGCIVGASIAQAGGLTFFLSERGFVACDGNTVTPIGTERVDRSFLTAHARGDLVDLWTAVDPKNTLIVWLMPGSPGAGWVYNWTLDRWSKLSINNGGIVQALSSYTAIDQLDGLIDDYNTLIDDPQYAGGVPLLFVVSPDGELGTLSGSNMAATIGTAFNELAPGNRVRPYRYRPISDAIVGVTVATDARMRLGDTAGSVSVSTMQTNGDMPVRANGRYLALEVTIAAGTTWSFIQGLEVEFGSGGKR